MGLINVRDIVPFPSSTPGNVTDTIINGVHFNSTALTYYNYTLYSNFTLSNGSNCYLVFSTYQPSMLSNGTFINGTDCSVPINPLETRGRLGAIFGALFGLSLIFTLINLKKHGQTFLPQTKRFNVVGRRWQWYWMIFTGACGMISCITGIDVDRDYLQGTAIILQSLFFLCAGQSAVAAVWEAVRHWGSWQERQVVDRDPFGLKQDDTRGKIEFYMPLIFYTFAFMSFFMTVPRSWTKIPDQGGYAQQQSSAMPAATDARFKVGGILLGIAWLVIAYCIRHNLKYYRTGNSLKLLVTDFPLRYTVCFLLAGVFIAYMTAISWIWNISIMKYDSPEVWPFAAGYTPCVLILIILNYFGFMDQNEDKQIIQQRITRGHIADSELGLTKKPNWWSKARGDHHLDGLQRLRGLVGQENIHTTPHRDDAVEMKDIATKQETKTSATTTSQQDDNLRSRSTSRNRLLDTPNTLNRAPSNNSLASTITLSAENAAARQQHIRSMLDV